MYLRKLDLSPSVGSIVHEVGQTKASQRTACRLSLQTPLSLFFYSKLNAMTLGHVEGLFIVRPSVLTHT